MSTYVVPERLLSNLEDPSTIHELIQDPLRILAQHEISVEDIFGVEDDNRLVGFKTYDDGITTTTASTRITSFISPQTPTMNGFWE